MTRARPLCRVKTGELVKFSQPKPKAKQRGLGSDAGQGAAEPEPGRAAEEMPGSEDKLNPVVCAVCDTEVGLRDAADGVFHFFNTFASNA